MSEVVALREGTVISGPGSPDASVVVELEGLLERARSGEVIGVTYSIEFFDGSNGNRYVGRVSRATVGGLFLCLSRLTGQLNDG